MLFENDLTGSFMLSLPLLDGHPFYEMSVLYIYEHNQDGVKALVVNKPVENSLQQIIKSIFPHSNVVTINDAPVLMGGPNNEDYIYVLSYDEQSKQYTVSTSRKLLLDIAEGNGPIISHIFSGMCQWTNARFFSEFRRNYWILAKPSVSSMMKTPMESRYQMVMESLGILDAYPLMGICAEA
ncbi:MAG: hypothetical protein CMF42_04980 [Legionellales bacterium]|nr:hypothetical protein [Legionellales bacterium]|tara:strand:- start:975 stop:1520 length:546 start_codon:yes stop_codon:yes gene_type:complete